MTCRAEVLWCDASQQEFFSFALMASDTSQTQKCHLHGAVQVHEGDCFQPSHTSLEPVFALYLEIQVDEKLTINGVNRAHYTESFAYTSLENTKSYCRSHCWLQKRPSEVSLTQCCSIQAEKAGCFQPSHASFPQDQVRPMEL